MWFPSKLREVFGRVKGSSLGLSSSMSYQGHCHCFHGDVILSTGYNDVIVIQPVPLSSLYFSCGCQLYTVLFRVRMCIYTSQCYPYWSLETLKIGFHSIKLVQWKQ